jgi:aspartyl protease family protein
LSFERLVAFSIGIVVVSLAVPRIAPELIARWTADMPPAETGAVQGPDSARTAPAAAEEPSNPQLVPGYGRQVALNADRSGHYFADATVNGIAVRVMVDTGATLVALTADTASRLGIYPSQNAYRLPIATANGATTAAAVTLDHVRLGNIDVYNVQAAVMPAGALSINLLGMSFLGKLSRFQAGGGQLVLVE